MNTQCFYFIFVLRPSLKKKELAIVPLQVFGVA